jgi:hypothetical protein
MVNDEMATQSKQYPIPSTGPGTKGSGQVLEEHAQTMERRQALLDDLKAPRLWLRPEERSQIIEYLNQEYGSDEVQRMLPINEELMGRTEKGRYDRYLDLYRRFGGGRRLLKPGEHADLSARQARLERCKRDSDPPLTPAQEKRLQELTDLLMIDWPLWEDLVPENPPAEMPEQIKITYDYPPPLDELLTLGEYGDLKAILRKMQPQEKYIPDLVHMALDLELLWASSDDLKVYAPTHAVQLLGMMRAKEAAEPLLSLLDLDQDWAGEELPDVYAGIGPGAIPYLQRYLADPEQDEFGRIRTAHALQEIAAAHPAERDRVVNILQEQLRQGRQIDRGLNAFLISYLTDLKAEEALDDVKAAYLADKVDRMVVGNWNDVRREFGLPPDPEVPSRPIWTDSPLGGALKEISRLGPAPMPSQLTSRPETKVRPGRKAARQARKRARRRRKKRKR